MRPQAVAQTEVHKQRRREMQTIPAAVRTICDAEDDDLGAAVRTTF